MNSDSHAFVDIMEVASGGGAESTPKTKPRVIPERLPILGLTDIVIFPGMVSPLLVESLQCIRLIDDVVAGNRLLGVVLQKNPKAEEPKPSELWAFGCVARVQKMLKFPDNTVRVLVEGLQRFQVKRFVATRPYLRASIKLLADLRQDSVELRAIARSAHKQFQEIAELSPALSDQVKITALNTEEPGALADLIAAHVNLSLEERQTLLEMASVQRRLKLILPLLQRELEVLTLGSKIQKEVSNSMSKSQRDFFLREQLRAIRRELGEADPAIAEINALREQVDSHQLPDEARRVALSEIEKLQTTPPAAAEYSVARNYVEWLVGLPWAKSTRDLLDLPRAERILNQAHYGLEPVKQRLIEFLAVIKLKREIRGPILCLTGPPGVGKTSLGRSIARALGRNFARISLGGIRDEAEIRGHRRTYVGALPGRIIQSLKRVGTNNPVILLDELDKMGTGFRGDPASALLEVLDPLQNASFTDHYLDVPFDLTRILFLTTANWLEPVHPALRDRLEVIALPSYTQTEKVEIAKRHLVPTQLKEHGLSRQATRIAIPGIRTLIRDYTHEAGVRQLEREIANVMRKAAKEIVTRRTNHSPIRIDPQWIRNHLGPPKFGDESAEAFTESGIAVGLAWTPVGGDILYIEASRVPGTGKLLLTGSLGDVMKESAQTALTYLRGQAKQLAFALDNLDQYDIHIHVPAGATPKDGPSAGTAIAVALTSLFTQRQVRSDLAMTGEISLRGRVLKVAGIREKMLAASRYGIKHVCLPEQNQNDWFDLPEELQRKIKVHFVKLVSELFPLALRRNQPRGRKGVNHAS